MTNFTQNLTLFRTLPARIGAKIAKNRQNRIFAILGRPIKNIRCRGPDRRSGLAGLLYRIFLNRRPKIAKCDFSDLCDHRGR